MLLEGVLRRSTPFRATAAVDGPFAQACTADTGDERYRVEAERTLQAVCRRIY